MAERVFKELPLAVMDEEAELKQNTFRDGKDASGSNIGHYSTEPTYVSIGALKKKYGSQIPTSKLTGRGKKGRGTKFKNGSPRKSRYYPDGYKGFRDDMGRPTDRVNLKLSGQLEGSIKTGFSQNEATIAFISDEQAAIASGHEEKYDADIFAVPKAGRQRIYDRLIKAANEALHEEMT